MLNEMMLMKEIWENIKCHAWVKALSLNINCPLKYGLPRRLMVKNPSANAGDTGLIPASERFSGEGNGKPLRILVWRTR